MLIYRSRIFDLYTTNVSSRCPPLDYVGHRGTCAVLIVDEGDQVGLLAQHRPAIGRTLFEVPAGMLDHEKSIEESMALELAEETGLRIEPPQLQRLTSLYTAPGYSTELLTLFFLCLTQMQRRNCHAMRWFNLNELNQLIHDQEICDMKTVVAITAYQAVLWKGAAEGEVL